MKLKKVQLGTIAQVLNGYAFKSNEYVDDGIRVIRITNVQKGQIQDDDPRFIAIHRCDEFARFMLDDGDILISLTGNVGRVGKIKKSLLPAALNQRVGALKIESESVDSHFLFHLLNSEKFEQDAIKNSKGVAQLNLSSKWVERYEIPLPPLAEQKRIAAILDAADTLRAKRREALAQLDALIQSSFLELFGDPVTNPMGWQLAGFDDCIDDKTSWAIKIPKTEYCSHGSWQIIDQSQQEIAGYSDVGPPFKEMLPVVVFGDHTRCVKLVKMPFLLGADGAKLLAPKENMNPFYLSHLLPLLKLPDLGYSRHMKEVKRLLYPLPPLPLQRRFAAIVESVECQKSAQRAHLAELDALFASLQHRAFRGEF